MKVKIAVVLALWVLFGAFGVAVYQKTKTVDDKGMGFVTVAGLDGDVYLRRYCDMVSLFRMRKRHPAEAIVAAPFAIVGSSVNEKAGEDAAKIALVAMSAALAAATVCLLWLVTKDAGAMALWLSFAYVWLLASAPELFAVSQAILIGTLLMVRRGVKDCRAWVGMAALAGGTTVTNVIKPLVAWGVSLWHDRTAWAGLRQNGRRLALGALIALVALAAIEVGKWYLIDRMSPAEEIAIGWQYVTKWFSGGFGLGERLARIWEMFFLEPLMTHGAIFGQANADGLDLLPLGYSLPLPHVVGAGLYGLCAWGAWKGRREPVVQAALAMVAFDVLLHVVIGWGLVEAQIYCGHWMFVVPVLISGLAGRWWKFALAAAVFGWNLQFVEVFL